MEQNEEYKKEYEAELSHLEEYGIENIEINTNEGKRTLAEILQTYGGIYMSENDQGVWGQQW